MLNIDQNLWEYILEHTTPEDSLLSELYRETHVKVLYPRMISGHYQGKLLELISKIIQPECILEIGTFTGYSAICLAKGLKPGGKLHTIEYNDEITDFARKYFKKAGLENSIELHIGNALQIIPGLNLQFDLIFMDADKTSYPDYFNLVTDKLKTGGILLTDNVLWDGKVIDESAGKEDETNGIIQFNKMIQNDSRFENIIIPIRDGIMLARKIS